VAGLFDDLIPQDPSQAAPAKGGLFDDLIPAAPSGTPLPPRRPAEFAYNSDALDPAGAGYTDRYTPPPVENALDDAPFRTGGAILDDLLRNPFASSSGADTGMLTGPDAMDAQKKREAEAQANLDEKRRLEAEQLATPSMAQDNLLGGVAAGQDAIVKRIEDAQAGRATNRAILDKAKVGQSVPTQTDARSIAEAGLAGIAGIPAGIVDAPLIAAEGFARANNQKAVADLVKGASESSKAWFGGLAKSDPTKADDFTHELAQGVGSTVGFYGVGLLGNVLGLSGTAVTAAAGALPQASQMYREAEGKGATELQKWLAFAAGLGIGGTEALPVAHFLDNWNAASKGKLASVWGATKSQTREEFSQEAMQTSLENVIARGVPEIGLPGYDPERPWSKDVLEAGAVGAITGAGSTAPMAALNALAKPSLSLPAVPDVEPAAPPMAGVAPGAAAPQPGAAPEPAPSPPAGEKLETPPVFQPEDVAAAEPALTPVNSEPAASQDKHPGRINDSVKPLIPEDEQRLLMGAGVDPDLIEDMSPAQRAAAIAEARAAGVKPFTGELPDLGTPASPAADQDSDPLTAPEMLQAPTASTPAAPISPANNTTATETAPEAETLPQSGNPFADLIPPAPQDDGFEAAFAAGQDEADATLPIPANDDQGSAGLTGVGAAPSTASPQVVPTVLSKADIRRRKSERAARPL
jgi:hypothetical protein